MTCIVCIVAFAGVAGRNVFSTIIAPLLGAILNILMLVGVLYYAIVGAANTQHDTIVAGVFLSCLPGHWFRYPVYSPD